MRVIQMCHCELFSFFLLNVQFELKRLETENLAMLIFSQVATSAEVGVGRTDEG